MPCVSLFTYTFLNDGLGGNVIQTHVRNCRTLLWSFAYRRTWDEVVLDDVFCPKAPAHASRRVPRELQDVHDSCKGSPTTKTYQSCRTQVVLRCRDVVLPVLSQNQISPCWQSLFRLAVIPLEFTLAMKVQVIKVSTGFCIRLKPVPWVAEYHSAESIICLFFWQFEYSQNSVGILFVKVLIWP